MQMLSEGRGPTKVLRNIAVGIFVSGGGYYLWMQHQAHVLQYLPFAFFLLCPLMHLFGGHGHGGHHSEENSQDQGGRHA